MNKYRPWLVLSIVLHAMIALHISQGGDPSSAEKESEEEQTRNLEKDDFNSFIDKETQPKEMTVNLVFEDEGKNPEDPSKKPEPETTESDSKCEGSFYYGIGVRFDGLTIMEVAKGYAADRAGIKVGDLFTSYRDHRENKVVEGYDFRGEEGRTIDIYILRDGRKMTFTVTTEKVCHR